MKKNYKAYLMMLLTLCFVLSGCTTKQDVKVENTSNTISQIPNSTTSEEVNDEKQEQIEHNHQTAHQAQEMPSEKDEEVSQGISTLQFISTGNSDCILIENSGEYMIIDGGDNNDEDVLANYLKEQGITKLKYVVLTHPDADHCGGLDRVIESVEVENVFVGNGDADTKTYRDFVQAAMNKGMKPSVPLENEVFTLGTAKLTFYNQKSSSDDVNDNSLVMLYTNGDFKALFTGDAGQEVEDKLPLKEIGHIDLLKVGHHGSKTSTSPKFIQAIKPTYGVICCGMDNKYGHPHQVTLDTLNANAVQIYRTDLMGTVTFTQEGDNCTITKETIGNEAQVQNSPVQSNSNQASPSKQEVSTSSNNNQLVQEEVKAGVVYITKTGKKYHQVGCSYLKSSKQAIDLDEAMQKGYTACSKCS